jgi:hypothetical protein
LLMMDLGQKALWPVQLYDIIVQGLPSPGLTSSVRPAKSHGNDYPHRVGIHNSRW